ncbi:uncharacterized protein Bfra_003492 [Botrytis fragariae]|uniref:Uncharacterized protein n=1 Tax=Botrytis fragariae TaxID=1964551 RepID=A0A8H6EK09_9HELO|nr:uncharacterized protein Bfra_003492 [Botrytis fragariae]KAF5875039.1 hypothetical protein Bfra_003492 [Botrytis fragariae]
MHLTYHIRKPRDVIGNKSKESTDTLHMVGVERHGDKAFKATRAITGQYRTSLCCRQQLEPKLRGGHEADGTVQFQELHFSIKSRYFAMEFLFSLLISSSPQSLLRDSLSGEHNLFSRFLSNS